jgi:hypothetical protein
VLVGGARGSVMPYHQRMLELVFEALSMTEIDNPRYGLQE